MPIFLFLGPPQIIPLDSEDRRELGTARAPIRWDEVTSQRRRCHLRNLAARGLLVTHGWGRRRYLTISAAGWRALAPRRGRLPFAT